MFNRDSADFYTIPLPSSHHQFQRCKGAIPAQLLLLGICLFALFLGGCGPETSSSTQEELATTTTKIALDYQGHRNLTQAGAELEALEVANLNQWLLYVAETAISNHIDANQTDALVLLATDLGLQSNPIREYAIAHNLVAAPVALQPEIKVETKPQTEPVAVASQADVVTPVGDTTAKAVDSSSTISAAAVLTSSIILTTTPANNPANNSVDITVITPTVTPAPVEPTPDTGPQVIASSAINVRTGPGTDYGLVGALQQNEIASITGKNTVGDWWEVTLANGQAGWVYSALVQTAGDTNAVAVAANIPPPPPTATPAPTQPPAAPTEVPAEAPVATPVPAADPNGEPHFTLVSRRLWNKQENDGCVGKHLLRIHVLDANGGRLNGVRLKGIYTGNELVTGDQGKGDGIIEFDLHGSGEGFMVLVNNDGRQATSDRAEGFTTRSVDIDKPTLIEAGYCTNEEDCQIFYNSWGCQGHHSWEAIFKRNY